MKLASTVEMKSIEEAAIREGTPIDELIHRAARQLAATIRKMAPSGRIVVLVGPGNNGSDGLEAARLLASVGRDVRVYSFRRTDSRGFDGPTMPAEEDPDCGWLREQLGAADLVVDAILGIGQNRPPDGLLAQIIRTVNDHPASTLRRLAVDVPTGVDADTGAVPGIAFRANVTLGMGFCKRGVALYPGAEYAGRLETADLGYDPAPARIPKAQLSTVVQVSGLLPRRSAAGNKGSSGRLLFAGGSRDFVGAPALASIAAYRAGAGLVEIAVPASIRSIVAGFSLEPVYWPLPDQDGVLVPAAAESLVERMKKARALVVGPGMSLSPDTIAMMRSLLPHIGASDLHGAVIDADALNALAQIPDWWQSGGPVVVTPHPGEMSRLAGLSIAEVQRNRIETATRYAGRWNVVVVLKGAGTVIAAPDGQAWVNPTGGPNLATAGTGDVLSGIIGSLMAQGCEPLNAAVAGVFLHGRAGDLLRRRLGDAGTVASDLHGVLPQARLSILAEAEVKS